MFNKLKILFISILMISGLYSQDTFYNPKMYNGTIMDSLRWGTGADIMTIYYDAVADSFKIYSPTGTGISLAGLAIAGYFELAVNDADDINDGITNKMFLATERTKLTGIETSATADQTASEILTLLKTVDGTGSLLDADLLDGIEGSAFALLTGTQSFTGTNTFDLPIILTGQTDPAHIAGQLWFSTDSDALTFHNSISGTALQIGEEVRIPVRNNSGSDIPDGTPVYSTGAIGNRATIALAKADAHATSEVLGVTTHLIANNTNGYVTVIGSVNDVDTDGSPYGETWLANDKIYLSATTAGDKTNVEPTGNALVVELGRVLTATNNGSFKVHIRNGIAHPLVSVDDRITTFDGTSGHRIQDSGVTISEVLLESELSAQETDPVYIADPAFSITSQDLTDIQNLSGVNTGDDDVPESGDFGNLLDSEIDHDQTTNFLANEHIDWTGVSAGTVDISNLPIDGKGTQLTVNEAGTALEFGLASKYLPARKASVGTITDGKPVYAVSYNVGGWVEVEEADADDPSKMPAIGLAYDDLTNASTDRILLFGDFENYDTSTPGWSVNDAVYVSTTAGALTNVKPTGTAQIQKIGTVERVNVNNGHIIVSGAGRSNDVPNIASAYFWLGNGSGVATAVTMSGDATMDNAGAVVVGDDSHAHIYSNIDAFTEAQFYTLLSDVTQFYEVGDDISADESDPNVDTEGEIETILGIAFGTSKVNTSGYIWVADGTDFESVAMSGDVTISAGGATVVGNDSHDHTTTISGKSANVSDADFGDVTVASGVWSVENDSHTHTGLAPALNIKEGVTLVSATPSDLTWDSAIFDLNDTVQPDSVLITIQDGAFNDEFIELADAFGGDVSGTYGAIVITDDSHNHIYTNIDAFTEANLYTRLSDVTQFYEVGDDISADETDPVYIADPAFSITSGHLTILGNTSGTNSGDATYGIANTNAVKITVIGVASGEYARFNATGLESRTLAEIMADMNLSGTNTGDNSGTDDQTIDVFSGSGNTISLSLEGDGEANKTLDISGFTAISANTSKITNANHTGDVTGSAGLTIGADKVHDSMIDWGAGASQVNIADLGITATTTEINTPLDGALVTLTEFRELEAIGTTVISSADWIALSNLSGINSGDISEATWEGLLDLQDLQGAVTDAQVPNTITIDSATNFSGSLVGDVTGTQGATVVGNDSHTHAGTNITGTPSGDLGGTWGSISVDDDSHAHIYSNIDATTSANWAGRITDETGTGLSVFSIAPNFTTSITVGTTIAHYGDGDTYLSFTADNIAFVTGGVTLMQAIEGATDYMQVTELRTTEDNNTNDSQYVPMILHGTDATPPTASGFPRGTLYIQYTP